MVITIGGCNHAEAYNMCEKLHGNTWAEIVSDDGRIVAEYRNEPRIAPSLADARDALMGMPGYIVLCPSLDCTTEVRVAA